MDRRALVLLVLGTLVVLGADHRYHHLPEARPSPGFDFAVARAHLAQVTAYGAPHPVGTAANASVAATLVEVLAQAGYDPEVQQGYGCGPLGMCGSFRNVIATHPGRAPGGPAVLLLAHHDSTPATSGGHDNGLGVVVVLEIARQLAAGPALAHDVIILFDDGEEVGLLGAQAFLSEHPDGPRIAAAINVDGLSGPTTFRFVGPGDGWLAGVAARGVGRPWASSMLGEFARYSSGFDDSRLFAERSIPNVVLAGIAGYSRYHTPLDRAESVDPRVIAARGRDAVELLRAVADGPLASAPARGVYFDVLGLFLFGWPGPMSPYVAAAALLLVVLLVFAGGARAPLPVAGRAALGGLLALVLAVALPTLGRIALDPSGVDRSVTLLGSGLAAAWLLGLLGVLVVAWRFPAAAAGGVLGLGFGLAGLVTAFTHPGLSYLFIAPTLAGGIASLASLRLARGQGVSPFRPGPPLLLALALGASLSALVGVGDGVQASLHSSLPRALGLLGLYPVVSGASLVLRRRLVVGAALGAALALGGSAWVGQGARVEPSSVRVWSIDGNDHRLIVFGALPEGWRTKAEWRREEKVFPWSSGSAPAWVATATVGLGSSPELRDLKIEPVAEGRRIRAEACTARGAEQLHLAFPKEAAGLTLRVEGQLVPLPEAAAKWSSGWQTLSLASTIEGCVRLELLLPGSAPVEVWLSDLAYGRPSWVDRRLGPRAPHLVPQHLGDASMVSRRIRL